MQRWDVCWKDQLNIGFSYNPHIDNKQGPHISQMSIICSDCKALKFKGELKGLCCSSGKVSLSRIIDPPEPIKSFLLHNQKLFLSFSKFKVKYII